MKKLIYLIVLALVLGMVLTGCFLSNVGQVPANEQSGITYLTKGGPTESEAELYPLYAGQDWLVGEVLVWNDDTQVCVKYRLFDDRVEDPEDVVGDGWGFTETHLAVATLLEGIPTNNSGNPKVGNFPFVNDELEGVAEAGPYCIDFGDEEGELDVECADELVIAAHAVISRELGGCNEIGDVYGIASGTGVVWGVNMDTQSTAAIFTIGALPLSAVGPNGLAYDGVNDRFYYCEYYSNDGIADLYFWDGAEHLAGTLSTGTSSAGIANADFDNGKYYFINGNTDDLFEVTFNADGTIASTVKLDDIADDLHRWTFDGDIAVEGGVVYGWGKCGIHGKYEYFTYDILGGTFALITPTYQNSLQLAFGLDGTTLYGHDYYSGDFYEINTVTGVVILLFDAGVQFTDCSSGAICIPDIESETAWAADAEIEGDGEGTIQFVEDGKSWATYFNYEVTCPPEEVCINFSSTLGLEPGDSIEGPDTVYADLEIDAVGGNAVMLMPGNATDATYGAPNGGSSILNGCMDVDGGFGDASKIHEYVFTFGNGKSVSEFSLRMLDFGDYNPSGATNHLVTMKAYDASENEVASATLEYTSSSLANPRAAGSNVGDLYITGDACTAIEGQPGNWMWEVSGTGIVRIELEINEGRDPNIAFDNLCFTIEQH